VTALPTDLFDDLRQTLAPYIETFDDRKTLLAPLLSWQPVYRRIDWSGDATAFGTRLIELLSARQLSAVVQRLPVGEEQQAHIADLSRRLAACTPDAPQDVLAPIFNAYHQSVIARHENDRRWQTNTRFVRLTLIKDQGADAQGGRWLEQTREYNDLRLLMADTPYPAVVLLGARPGPGQVAPA
jgi:hypothetical protein